MEAEEAEKVETIFKKVAEVEPLENEMKPVEAKLDGQDTS